MQQKSIWIENINEQGLEKLNSNKEVDILIIGGGMTGISCAYHLKDSNLSVCLVDQGRIGSGTTAKTTGKINYLQETIYSDLTKRYSFNKAKEYLNSQLDAIKEINDIIQKEKIECNLRKVRSYVFTNDINEVEKLKKEKELLEKMGITLLDTNKSDISLEFKYAISVDDTYVFHPLKYLFKLKDICINSGVNIYENTKILKIQKDKDKYLCLTDNYLIKASKVILACHYPFFLFPFLTPLKVHIERSYISASKIEKIRDETYITSKLPCKSIRYHQDKENYLLYLTSSHNICSKNNEIDNFNKLKSDIEKNNLDVKYIWMNDDLMTVDKMPYIGKINDSLLLGTGYNTWGMTNGTIAGLILSDLVLNKHNKYEKLFSLSRINKIINIDGYIINLVSNMKSYIQNKLVKNKRWYSTYVVFKRVNGTPLGIYFDGKEKHIIVNKCPHLGCSLIFNEVEKTWDCPCHASRFLLDGKCIKGPSLYDISYVKQMENKE